MLQPHCLPSLGVVVSRGDYPLLWPQVSGQWNRNNINNLPRSSVISSFTIYPLAYLHHMDCIWIVHGLCMAWKIAIAKVEWMCFPTSILAYGPAWSHHQCPVNAVDIPILSLSFSDCIHHITQQGHSLYVYYIYIYVFIHIYIYSFLYMYSCICLFTLIHFYCFICNTTSLNTRIILHNM